MKSAKLYYFSGSGNTLKIAQTAMDVFIEKDYDCSLERMEDCGVISVNKSTFIGLFFPVAIQSTFPVVWDFIDRMPEGNGQKIFMIDTMEQFSGGIVGPLKKILTSKGYVCIGALEVKMNSSMHTKAFDAEKMAEKNRKAVHDAKVFIEDLLAGNTHWSRIPILSDWMRAISKNRKIWTKTSEQLDVSHDKCIQCGICIKNCPVQALSLVNGEIQVNHEVCNACTRCVHQCPKDAFTWNGKVVKRIG